MQTKLRSKIIWILPLLMMAITLSAGPAMADKAVIKFGQCCPPEQAYGVYAHGFADTIKKNGGGSIVVENLDGGVMGSEQEMAHQVQMGTIQMAGITTNNVAQLAPSLNVLVLPYMNSSSEDLLGEKGLLRPGLYLEELNKRVEQESGTIMVLGGFTNSFRRFFTKTGVFQN